MVEQIETRSKKVRGDGESLSRSDQEDVRHCRRGTADHRPRRRLQAIHRRLDRVDGDVGDGARLSSAEVTASVSASCTASPAPPPSMMLQKMMTGGSSSSFMSAITIRA